LPRYEQQHQYRVRYQLDHNRHQDPLGRSTGTALALSDQQQGPL